MPGPFSVCAVAAWCTFSQVSFAWTGAVAANSSFIANGLNCYRKVATVNTRPAPVLRAADKSRAHRVERNIPQGGEQMRFVHRHAAETALPEVPGQSLACVNPPRISPVNFRQRRPQGIDMIGNKDEVHVIGHEDIAPHRYAMRRTLCFEEVQIGCIVGILEECLLAPIAPLGDMVRDAGNDIASQTCHSAYVLRTRTNVN